MKWNLIWWKKPVLLDVGLCHQLNRRYNLHKNNLLATRERKLLEIQSFNPCMSGTINEKNK